MIGDFKVETKFDRTKVTIYKPDHLQRTPKIECSACHRQGTRWCEICTRPLCDLHSYPEDDGLIYCQGHAQGYVFPADDD